MKFFSLSLFLSVTQFNRATMTLSSLIIRIPLSCGWRKRVKAEVKRKFKEMREERGDRMEIHPSWRSRTTNDKLPQRNKASTIAAWIIRSWPLSRDTCTTPAVSRNKLLLFFHYSSTTCYHLHRKFKRNVRDFIKLISSNSKLNQQTVRTRSSQRKKVTNSFHGGTSAYSVNDKN